MHYLEEMFGELHFLLWMHKDRFHEELVDRNSGGCKILSYLKKSHKLFLLKFGYLNRCDLMIRSFSLQIFIQKLSRFLRIPENNAYSSTISCRTSSFCRRAVPPQAGPASNRLRSCLRLADPQQEYMKLAECHRLSQTKQLKIRLLFYRMDFRKQ